MKVTKLPPAPQEVFFQDSQFDPNIGEGTDPIGYFSGKWTMYSKPENRKKGRARQQSDSTGFIESKTKAAKQARKAAAAVKGHPREKEILAVLRGTKHE